MGDFTSDGGAPINQPEQPEVEKTEEEPTTFPTDVEGVEADAEMPYGKERFPMFKVSREEFYQNMAHGRRRIRFKSGSNAQKYMSGSKYGRPFYISFTDSDGKTYNRKIK